MVPHAMKEALGFQTRVDALLMAAKIWQTLKTMRLVRTRQLKTSADAVGLHCLPQELYNLVEDYAALESVPHYLSLPPFEFGRECCEEYLDKINKNNAAQESIRELRNTLRKQTPGIETFEQLETLVLASLQYEVIRQEYLERHTECGSCLTNVESRFWTRLSHKTVMTDAEFHDEEVYEHEEIQYLVGNSLPDTNCSCTIQTIFFDASVSEQLRYRQYIPCRLPHVSPVRLFM